METTLFSTFRFDRDLRSAMLGVCVLFLLTGLVGAFAVGAGGLSTESFTTDHCYSDAGSDTADIAVIPSCCGAIGCPMVGSALPGPANGAPLAIGVTQQIVAPRPELPFIPTQLIVALDTARGPPPPF